MDNEELVEALEDAWSETNTIIEFVKIEAATNGQNVMALRDTTGNFIMAPLVQTKAILLSGMITMSMDPSNYDVVKVQPTTPAVEPV